MWPPYQAKLPRSQTKVTAKVSGEYLHNRLEMEVALNGVWLPSFIRRLRKVKRDRRMKLGSMGTRPPVMHNSVKPSARRLILPASLRWLTRKQKPLVLGRR